MRKQESTSMALSQAAGNLLRADAADVGRSRERRRRFRIAALAAAAAAVGCMVAFVRIHLPHVDPLEATGMVFFLVLILVIAGQQLFTGRSPHVTFAPEQIDVRLDDVKGIGPIKGEVVRTLNTFLAHKSFADQMGGAARRGVLFEGPPGTGKTFMAKAMAAEAGVPFMFCSATSFQSMWYGATAKKLRSFFKAARKEARRSGGVIAFLEELDAIGAARGGMSATPAPVTGSPATTCCGGLTGLPMVGQQASAVTTTFASEGTGGVVNELLVQMQSFDTPAGWTRFAAFAVGKLNALLPAGRQLPKPTAKPANVLVIAATNRGDALDPALLRPGRFDRRLSFEAPDQHGRREIIDHYMGKAAHVAVLDTDERRDALAAVTQGYTPVMIQNLLNEGLVNAISDGRRAMTWADLEHARLAMEVGLGQPVAYTAHEAKLIATHEAGHATMAWLLAPQRRLEILTIVKRRGALGLLAHGDREDVYTRSSKELRALIEIAMGGQVAEQLFFGDVSTGPGGDLVYATNVAVQMVSSGMCDSLVNFSAVQGSSLSDAGLVGRVLADSIGRSLVDKILDESREKVRGLMVENRHLVEALRDALLDRHELIGHELTDVLEAAQASHVAGAAS